VENPITGSTALAPGSIASIFGSDLFCTIGTTCPISLTSSATLGAFRPNGPEEGKPSVAVSSLMADGDGRRSPYTALSVLVSNLPARVVNTGNATNFFQIQIPQAATTGGTILEVTADGRRSNPFILHLTPVAPTLYPSAADASLGAFIVEASGAAITPQAPANPGQIVAINAIGLGFTNPAVPDGEPTPATPRFVVGNAVSVFVDDLPATVVAAELVPGFIGVYRVKFVVPTGAAFGFRPVRASMSVGGTAYSSNVVRLPVGQTVARSGSRFVSVSPCRVLDTRPGISPPFLQGGGERLIPVPQSACGIPASAKAYSLNATVVPYGPLSYLTLWPASAPRPLVSTLNSFDGRIVANAAIVPAGANGAISAFATNSTELILDINGYFTDGDQPDAVPFNTVNPCRLADTRFSSGFTGLLGSPGLTGGVGRNFPVLSANCGLPPGARAYSLNATVVPAGPLSYLTLWPTGVVQPFVSTLNALEGTIVANAALVPSGINGAVSAYATGNTDLILDVNGYFGSQGQNPLHFVPVAPCRVADTRNAVGVFGGPSLASGTTRDFPVQGAACGVPASARGYSLNVTVVPQGSLSYLTVWPAGAPRPLVSTLNAFGGQVMANAALVPAGTGGAISVFAAGTTDVIIDINGYFAP